MVWIGDFGRKGYAKRLFINRVSRGMFPILLSACMNNAHMGQTEGRPVTDHLTAEPVYGSKGMVATDNALATEVGARVLASGGNAADATVAVAFTLAVVYPEAGNIGGGGFIVTHRADGTNAALDFREVAPLKASRDMYVDADGKVSKESLTGHRASGVPGAVAGLYEFHKRYGSKPWRELLQPAINYAQNGFIVDEHIKRVIESDKRLVHFPYSAALLMPDGKPPEAGSKLVNRELAETLGRIANQGRDGFYKGETANLIVAEMERGGGLISHEDLDRYQAKWRTPIEFTYRGHKVISMAPASSGGITLAIMANILNGYDLKALGPNSAERYHLITEASRRAFADRNYFLGDADFVKLPTQLLLSSKYAAEQRATISRTQATPSRDIRPALGEVAEGTQTTHISIVDAQGNAVGFTTTLNELHGSAVAITGAGFFMNDEMDDFTSKVGEPNLFGLMQGENNSIAPGKRMLSAMTPTIVLDNRGRAMLITGGRGGPRIISAVFQIISNVLDHGMGMPDAVLAPRIHHQHLPDSIYYEPKNGIPPAAVAELRRMGHAISERSGYIADSPTILREGNRWVGVGDPRSGGKAVGVN